MTQAHTRSTRNVIVIGAGKFVLVQVLLAVHAFTDAKCLVICATGTRFLRRSILSSEYMEIDFKDADDDALLDRINRFSGMEPDALLIPSDCAGARLINRIRPRLTVTVIPTPSTPMLDCFDDKWHFYQFCIKHGLNVPLTHHIGNKHELDYAATAVALGLPFVVKPVNEDASRGAYVISNETEFRRHILDNDSYQYAPLIAQRYIEGTDVGLNLLSVQGQLRSFAIQQRLEPEHDGSGIRFFANYYLEKVAGIVVSESAYEGVMNIDARIEKNTGKVYLFESNPRFWRSLSASVWCGFNFVAQSAEQPCEAGIRRLTSGFADTYYHPLFRPSLWPYAILSNGHRGKMVRFMMLETCTLFMSIRILSTKMGQAGLRVLSTSFARLKRILTSPRTIENSRNAS